MIDIKKKLGVANMSDLTIKAIKRKYNTESSTQKQTRRYKKKQRMVW